MPHILKNPIFEVTRQMREKGGSFAQRLGSAIQVADEENTRRITEAFPELMKTYDEFATLAANQRESDPGPTRKVSLID